MGECGIEFYPLIRWLQLRAIPPRRWKPRAANLLQINRRDQHLNILQRELRTLFDHLAVDADHGGAIVVKAVGVAALEVAVEVRRAGFGARGEDEVDALVEFAELVVAARRVANDVDAVHGERVVSRRGRKELFAHLDAERDGRIVSGLEDDVPDVRRALIPNRLNTCRQLKRLLLPFPLPCCEVARLSEVAVVRQHHLRPDEEDGARVDPDAAVEVDGAVDDGHADVDEDAVEVSVCDYLGEHLEV